MVKIAKKNKPVMIKTRRGRFHIGLCQSGGDISNRLQNMVPGANVVIHKFNTPEELQKQLQRSYIDLLVLSASDDFSWLSDMVRRIKFHTQLQYIPLMVYAPGADKNLVINCLSECADDITISEWDDSLMSAKAMMLVTRAQRDMGVNPSSSSLISTGEFRQARSSRYAMPTWTILNPITIIMVTYTGTRPFR